MKILITGATGRIGFELTEEMVKKGHKIIATSLNNDLPLMKGVENHKIDFIRRDDVIRLIKTTKPEVVIHTIALTNVDLCETDHDIADNVNSGSVQNIADACSQLDDIKIVYVSSSFVFDGKQKIFRENDIPNPINYYGKTKLDGEKILQKSGLGYLILRTDQPYNWPKPWQKPNNITRCIDALKNNKQSKELIDWYNNPTFIPNFVDATLKLIEKDKKGIYHLVGHDFINRYEWSLKIAHMLKKPKHTILPINSKELNLPARRPNANLSNEKVQKDTGIKFFGIDEGLNKMFNKT